MSASSSSVPFAPRATIDAMLSCHCGRVRRCDVTVSSEWHAPQTFSKACRAPVGGCANPAVGAASTTASQYLFRIMRQCTIGPDMIATTYHGRRAAALENDALRVTVLREGG